MALSDEQADAHVCAWEKKLQSSFSPQRGHWPSRLFHHAPIENAVSIIVSGVLRSRKDPENPLQRNIAGQGVIDSRDDAHHYVRLYFRPKTPTQFHIEGVRKKAECQEYGFQAPVLIMFIFDARKVLSRDGTQFSAENMQKLGTPYSGDSKFFQEIPFDKVYHDGGLNGDRSIIAHRCAEVLAISPLELDGTIQWIYCRSDAERDTLIYKLGENAPAWQNRIKVSNDIRVFNRIFCYVEHVHLSREGVIVEFHPRNDGKNIDVEIVAKDKDGRNVAYFKKNDFSAYPKNGKRWRIGADLRDGIYNVTVYLEGEESYSADLVLGDALI